MVTLLAFLISERPPPPNAKKNEKDWEEAARLLNVAAEAYEDVVHVVPDFPDVAGEGPPLAKTRPHDMDTFHHVNLAMAHLQGARKVAIEIDDMTGKTE